MSRSLPLLALLAVLPAGAGRAQIPDGLTLGGDFRLRYEYTSEGNGTPSTSKEVVRLRVGLTYPLTVWVLVRARAATGAPGDPNSTDVTLSQFVDDLAVSLDLVSVELNRPHWGFLGGKFNNPFLSTELVWDTDVNPSGVAGRLTGGKKDFLGNLTAIYFVIDQQPNGLASDMIGGQLGLSTPAGTVWRLTAGLAYYDYRIRSLIDADPGDIRTNRLAPDGEMFLSDFNLLDAVAIVEYAGLGERFPLRVVGDFVRNLALDSGPNTGWSADLFVGRIKSRGDIRARYGYALAETDAVLAAFAHDNTTLGSNSETHTLVVEGVPIDNLLLNATWYLFRPHEVLPGQPREYQNRLRLNATVAF